MRKFGLGVDDFALGEEEVGSSLNGFGGVVETRDCFFETGFCFAFFEFFAEDVDWDGDFRGFTDFFSGKCALVYSATGD